MWLNMFRAPLRPSSGAYNYTRGLWFYHWSVAVAALLVVVWQTLARILLKSFQILNHLVAFRFIYKFVKIWKSKCRLRAKSFEGVASGCSSFFFAKGNVATGSFGHQAKPFWKTATS
jgi:glucan phosphoethanolaminetransferase (alkaline phosphatase superfamily)